MAEKPEFAPGDLVRYFYAREKAGNKFHRCFVGPYVIVNRESDMNYKICGKLRASGREDIRIVHADHLIHYEEDRAKLFPQYGPAFSESDEEQGIPPHMVKNPKPLDIFAHPSSEDEVECISSHSSSKPVPSEPISGSRAMEPGSVPPVDNHSHPTPDSAVPGTGEQSPVTAVPRRRSRRKRKQPERLKYE